MSRRHFLAGCSAMALGGCAGLSADQVAERWPPEGTIIEIDGLPVHLWDAGTGQPVILIHGASGNLRDFTFSLAPRLARNFRVIAVDRPGFGYSARLPDRGWDPAEQARHLHAATQKLGVARPIVLGHSWGGAVAMAWASAFGQDLAGAISLSGATMPWGGGVEFYYSLIASEITGPASAWLINRALSESRITEYLDSVFAPQPVPPGYAQFIGGPLATRPSTLRANAKDLVHLNDLLVRQSALYAGIACPVDIIHGTADTTVPADLHARGLDAVVPVSRLTLLDGVGHMPHHSHPAAIEAALRRLETA